MLPPRIRDAGRAGLLQTGWASQHTTGFTILELVSAKLTYARKVENHQPAFEMAEDLPLLHDGRLTPSEPSDVDIPSGLSTSQLMRLYLSHFLSTWNSRCYEFAAVGAFL